jgi:hypothetical protein
VELSRQFIFPAVGIVWRVVYPNDSDNPSRQLAYDCLLWANRITVRAWASTSVGSPINGEEKILCAAGENPTVNGGLPDPYQTPFPEMKGDWVLINYGQGLASWPIVVQALPTPFAADNVLAWKGTRTKGRRDFQLFNDFEWEITQAGDVLCRLTEPATRPDDANPQRPDYDEDSSNPMPAKRQREVTLYASNAADAKGLAVHFHKRHFAVKIGTEGDGATARQPDDKSVLTLAVAASAGDSIVYVSGDLDAWPAAGYMQVGGGPYPFYSHVSDTNGKGLFLGPSAVLTKSYSQGTSVQMLLPSNDPYTPTAKWTSVFSVQNDMDDGEGPFVNLGGAGKDTCPEHVMMGDATLTFLHDFSDRLQQLEKDLFTHSHDVTISGAVVSPGLTADLVSGTVKGALTLAKPVVSSTAADGSANSSLVTELTDWAIWVTDKVNGILLTSNMDGNLLSWIARIRKKWPLSR